MRCIIEQVREEQERVAIAPSELVVTIEEDTAHVWNVRQLANKPVSSVASMNKRLTIIPVGPLFEARGDFRH